MSTPILVVIPFHAGNAPVAERLCDWIFELAGREQRGHVLLVCDAACHAEMRTKILVAAEVAFQTATLAVLTPTEALSPTGLSNKLFQFAAAQVAAHYRCAWLWLEPESVPLHPDWQEDLAQLYASQPKRYLGNHLKLGDGLALHRIAVYSVGALNDYTRFCDGQQPFWMAAIKMVASSTRTKLIQPGTFDPEKGLEQVRPESLIFHADPSGALIEMLRTKAATENAPKRRGRPPKIQTPTAEPVFT